MQSLTAIRSLNHLRHARSACSCIAAGAGDSAVHSELPLGEDLDEEQQRQKAFKDGKTKLPLATDKAPPFASAPRLEKVEVTPPSVPSFQQKRQLSHAPAPALDGVSCFGWDGAPLKGEGDDDRDGGDGGVRQEEENRAYFEKHKASPLSEVEFVDTRRPISGAWDRGAVHDDVVGVIVEDTVDEALQRAEAMFRAAKERGDPDTPWGRVLAMKCTDSTNPV